jgi:mannose-6-phosphate isomerase-like protein (cupin superfamily)
MTAPSRFTHIDKVSPENMDKGDGWLITEFRLPFSEREGLGTTMFHARFNPGSVHKKHRHANCEEIYYLVAGEGIAGAGGATEEVRAGHFHYVPADTEHWLVNANTDVPIEVVGWYLGAGSVAATGYGYMGDVTEPDRAGPHEGYTVGALAHADDAVEAGALRIGLGERQGIGHTAWQMSVRKTDGRQAQRLAKADAFLYVASGRGRAGVGEETQTVSKGSCIHVPAGEPFWLEAASDEPLTVIGLYEGVGAP